MTDDHLRRIDFSLLLIFQSVMKHRQLTAAAQELGLTQSALSHALKKLREIVGEDLFIRRQLGVEPTEKAYALIGPVDLVVETTRDALKPATPFSPDTTKRVFRLVCGEIEAALIAPAIFTRMAMAAPSARLDIAVAPAEAGFAALADARADLGLYGELPPHGAGAALFSHDPLLHAGQAVAVPRGHETIRKKLSLKRYLASRHVQVRTDGRADDPADRALLEAGQSRPIAASTDRWSTAFHLAETCGLIVTAPRAAIAAFGAPYKMRVLPVPFDLRPYGPAIIRHQRTLHDPACTWLAALARETRQDIALAPPATG